MKIDEKQGVSAFYRDKNGDIYHTYSSYERGIDLMNTTYNFLDLTAEGCDGNPDAPQDWVRYHGQIQKGIKRLMLRLNVRRIWRTVPLLAGASLIAAGAIQFTRWKMTHLLRCRSPFGCAVSCPQHETSFRLGCKQGAVCCICCAAPMTIQLALGIMNPLRSQQPPRCWLPPSRDFVSGPCAHSPCPGGCGSALVRCAKPRNYAHIPSSASSAALRKQDTRGVSSRWRGVLPSS